MVDIKVWVGEMEILAKGSKLPVIRLTNPTNLVYSLVIIANNTLGYTEYC